jgi:hypothetical protein
MMRLVVLALLVAQLAACAEFSPDGGMDTVQSGVRREIGRDVVKIANLDDARRAREQVASLLQGQLSADTAVQVALLSNRDLQVAYNDLGISEAAYVQASLPKNPGISLMRYGGTGVANFEVRLIVNLLDLITLPTRTKIAAERYQQAKHTAVQATLSLAADVRRAFVRAVAAERQVRFLDQARQTADAAAKLVAKLGEAGQGDLQRLVMKDRDADQRQGEQDEVDGDAEDIDRLGRWPCRGCQRRSARQKQRHYEKQGRRRALHGEAPPGPITRLWTQGERGLRSRESPFDPLRRWPGS